MIENIIHKYGLKEFQFQQIFKGYTCNKWIIKSDIHKYLLKEMNITKSKRVEFINLIQNNVSSYNLAPRIIDDMMGNNYVCYEDKIYVMYEFLEGHSLKKKDLSKKQIYDIGSFLGKMHKIMSNISLDESIQLFGNSLSMTTPNIDKINMYIREYSKMNCMMKVEEKKRALKILNDKLLFLKDIKYDRIKDIFLKYNSSIVHGDFYLDNLLVTANGIMCVDFDQTCVFPIAYEIFRAISMICYEKSFNSIRILNNIKFFMEGYKSENYITNNLLKDGLELFIYITYNSLYCLKPGDNISYADYKYTMVNWLISNKQSVLESVMVNSYEKTNTGFSFSLSKKER